MLAIATGDVIVGLLMLICLGGGAYGATRGMVVYARAGSALSSVAACLGVAYFGYRPFFGGSHTPGTYFGSTVLVVAILFWCLFMAIGERKNTDER
jgi:hypothetical protein